MRFRATLWNIIHTQKELSETALKYGLIPMNVPRIEEQRENMEVYFVIPAKAFTDVQVKTVAPKHNIPRAVCGNLTLLPILPQDHVSVSYGGEAV